MIKKELNDYYRQIYNKDFPTSTLSKWSKEGRIRREINEKGFYDYNFEDFKSIVDSEEYKKKLKARKANPKDYIGETKGHFLIKGIVPKEARNDKNYLGTIMYCDCLKCGKQDVQVRFAYLTDNGKYHKTDCGCGDRKRKIKAFLASTTRKDFEEEWIESFQDIEKFLFIHKALIHNTNHYYIECSLNEYKETVEYFYNDIQFNAIYQFWKTQEKGNTFYDLAKPSLDHIMPKSKNGTNKRDNLQFLTLFENLAKRDMTQEEWEVFKIKTNTKSQYFIESILKGGKDDE